MQKDLEGILKATCAEMYVRIIRIGMEEDHVHMYVSIPPVKPIPKVIQRLKGISSKLLREKHGKWLAEYYWKPVLWAVGYFVSTVGNVDEKIIRQYVENQGKQDIDDECIALEEAL